MKQETNELLNKIEKEVRRHCCLRVPEYYTVNTLFPVLTHCIRHANEIDIFKQFPMLGYLSPEPDSGKTRANKVTAKLSYNAIRTGTYTSARLLNLVDKAVKEGTFPITTSQEELDKKLTSHQDNSQLIEFYNTGWEYDAVISRMSRSGSDEGRDTPSGCPKIFDGLHAAKLPEDTRTRSIILMLRPWTEEEQPKPLDDIDDEALADLNAEITAWSERDDVLEALKETTFGDEVKFLVNRKYKIWRGLLGIAKLAGPEWFERSLQAARFFTQEKPSEELPNHKALLGFFHEFVKDYADKTGVSVGRNSQKIHTKVLLEALAFPRWYDEGHLAKAFLGYSIAGKPPIRPRQMKIDGSSNQNGYEYRLAFPSWKIYLDRKEITDIMDQEEIPDIEKKEILELIGLRVDRVDTVDGLSLSRKDGRPVYNNNSVLLQKPTSSTPQTVLPLRDSGNPSTPSTLSTLDEFERELVSNYH